MRRLAFLFAVMALLLASRPVVAQEPPRFEDLLQQGKIAEAEKALDDALKSKPEDDNARFALGTVQFLHAVEARMQAFYRYGFRDNNGMLPLTNLPVPHNPKPEPLDYPTARKLLQSWIDDLAKVDATLSKIKSSDATLPLHFGLIGLDFNGDGKADEGETLWKIYGQFNKQAQVTSDAAKNFVVKLDRGDVDWLRGYCHLLSALAEGVLAYDFADLFRQAGFILFEGVPPPQKFLVEATKDEQMMMQILDYIALIHEIRLPVAEPNRLKAVQAHMEKMIALSRSSWKYILAETDDDQEWLPNPNQKSVIPEARISADMVKGWYEFLDEFEAILQGKKLVPFWRGSEPRPGLNIHRVLTEPRPLDLILWVQGTAAAPYLEKGDVTSPATWQRLNTLFQGQFVGFALWIN